MSNMQNTRIGFLPYRQPSALSANTNPPPQSHQPSHQNVIIGNGMMTVRTGAHHSYNRQQLPKRHVIMMGNQPVFVNPIPGHRISVPTMTVPVSVPSLFHNSYPLVPSFAQK